LEMKRKAKEDAIKAEELAKEWKAKKAKMDAEWKAKKAEMDTSVEKKDVSKNTSTHVNAEPVAKNATNSTFGGDHDFLGDSGPEPGAPISSTPTPAWKSTAKPAQQNKDGWLDWMWR